MSDKHQTIKEDLDPNTPPVRKAEPETGKTDQLKDRAEESENRQEALIDQAVEESMDASDPPSPKHIT